MIFRTKLIWYIFSWQKGDDTIEYDTKIIIVIYIFLVPLRKKEIPSLLIDGTVQ